MFIFALRKLGLFDVFWLATKLFFATEANFSLHRSKIGAGGVAGSSILSFQIADGQRVRSLLEWVAHLVRELLVF